MWEPEPGWHPMPGGSGASTVGVWRAAHGDRAVVVKRLARPAPGDPGELSDPAHPGYWRREADVAETGVVHGLSGLRGRSTAVEEDADGVTLTGEWVEDAALTGLFLAAALGRFAGADLPRTRFLARDLLRQRLERTDRLAGGWPTLARTTVADVADHLWSRREVFLTVLDGLPQVPVHGDPTLGNLRGRSEADVDGTGDDVVAVDWGTLGVGPVGTDLGLLSLVSREDPEPLLDAHLLGLPDGVAHRDQVLLGAQVVGVYTALGRAEWALARVAGGEGALAGKYRHPAVAPHLRALQRQFPAIEALLAW